MKYPDEMLMAYADGELDPAQRAAIEQAMRTEPEVAARVASHQALRRGVFAAFAQVLDEPVPEHLKQASARGRVVQIDHLRERRGRAEQVARWSWQRLGGMAAMLAVGVLIGSLAAGRRNGDGELTVARGPGAGLMAGGRLDQALTHQLAGSTGDGVRVGPSFVSKQGGYCRSFVLGATAGLACREGGKWQIPVLAHAAAQDTAYRQAASELPQAVLDEVDARISGATLDAGAERLARERGWEAGRR
jgi:hypothetical protein